MASKYVSNDELDQAVELIAATYAKKSDTLKSNKAGNSAAAIPRILVSLSGRPGSGKTTVAKYIADAVRAKLDATVTAADKAQKVEVCVMQMDGYHLYRRELGKMANAAEAFRRRGAEWTFNPAKMAHDLDDIRTPVASTEGFYKAVYVPSFDHGVGDPLERASVIPSHANVIIVEGNYLLYRGTPEWARVSSMFDVKLFLRCARSVCTERLCKRHMKAHNISREEAMVRASGSDTINGDLVDSTASMADFVLHSVEVDDGIAPIASSATGSSSQPGHHACGAESKL